MFELIKRIIVFALSILLLADSFLPANEFAYTIDRHQIIDEDFFTKNYQLLLIGGPAKSCSIGYTTYKAVNDGDSVIVKSSRIFQKCLTISFNGQIVFRDSYGRLLLLILGLGALAVAYSWRNDDAD